MKPVLAHAGEGGAAIAAEMEAALPGAFEHIPALDDPNQLAALRERGTPHAVFLHDFTPACPTRHLWHRRQEACGGPGRTGWKCAWCVAGTRRRWPQLPFRFLAFRHRPQQWHTALLRADLLIAPSRFARAWWIEHNLPGERIVVVEPRLGSAAAAAAPPPDGLAVELARELAPAPLRERAARELLLAASGAAPAYARDVAEAQAAGRPVVAPALGSYSEQIIHGVNGFLAAPGDFEAISEAIVEALAPPSAAWAGERLAPAAAAQAADSLHALAAIQALLTSTTRELPPPAVSYARQLTLNHGVAFLRACGCRRIAYLPENKAIPADAAAHLARWGLPPVPAEELPDGLWFEAAADQPAAEHALLRRRFPQAKALVEVSGDDVETSDWND